MNLGSVLLAHNLDLKVAIAHLAYFTFELDTFIIRLCFWELTLLVDTILTVTFATELAEMNLFVAFEDEFTAISTLCGANFLSDWLAE